LFYAKVAIKFINKLLLTNFIQAHYFVKLKFLEASAKFDVKFEVKNILLFRREIFLLLLFYYIIC